MNDKDLKIVSHQIRRKPKNAIEVANYCSYGFPVVIKAFPVLDDKPFPTLYWLTCPFLIRKISSIESNGGILRYEEILRSDFELYSEHVESNIKAREMIRKLVGDRAEIMRRFEGIWIGGIKDIRYLKCLHLHVAYHLGGIENPVGRLIISDIGKIECADGVCKRWNIR